MSGGLWLSAYPGRVLLQSLDIWVFEILYWAAIPVGFFTFIHAALQRADAYTATDKLTKPAWLGITGGATAALLLFRPWEDFLLLWLIALVAVLVYLVDVKPAVTEVQRGPRW
ncbi:MAG: DUF2516 family protein [Pseudonocardiaceae bacterium]